eukprot:5698268-Ditylum_brightwellii.AAC.1
MKWRLSKKKINAGLQNKDEEEDISKDESSSSSLEEEDPITQEEEFKKPTKPTMLINVMARNKSYWCFGTSLLVIWVRV